MRVSHSVLCCTLGSSEKRQLHSISNASISKDFMRQFQTTSFANRRSCRKNSHKIYFNSIRLNFIFLPRWAAPLCHQWLSSMIRWGINILWPNVLPYVLILLVRLLLFFSTWAHHRSSNGIFLWLVKIIKLQNIKNDVVISHVRNFFAQICRFFPFHMLFSTGLCYFFLTIYPPQHIINFDKWR